MSSRVVMFFTRDGCRVEWSCSLPGMGVDGCRVEWSCSLPGMGVE